MNMPDLDFRARYVIDLNGAATEVPRHWGGPLEAPLRTQDAVTPVQLTHTAKWDGPNPVLKVGNLLPRMDVTARIVQQAQLNDPIGTDRGMRNFPYKLKAVGWVNPYDIMLQQGIGNSTLVSQDFEIVP